MRTRACTVQESLDTVSTCLSDPASVRGWRVTLTCLAYNKLACSGCALYWLLITNLKSVEERFAIRWVDAILHITHRSHGLKLAPFKAASPYD
jgi:hypothetical protein